MKRIDAWLFFANVSYKEKEKNGYIKEIIKKAQKEYDFNLEVKNVQNFHIVSGEKNELYYDGKLVKQLPTYAIIRRYEIYLMRQLELMGVQVFNSVSAMIDARNKMKVHQILASNYINTPKTVYTVFKSNCDNVLYKDITKILGSKKFILKWIYGSQGKHVYLVQNEAAFNELVKKYKGRILCQEFIEESFGMDIRAYVINSKFIGAAIRKSNGDNFKSNLAQGGEALPVEYNDEIINIAEKSAKAVGLDICGVDILVSKKGYYICEVNALPGFKSIKKVCDIDEKDILLGLIKNKIDNK